MNYHRKQINKNLTKLIDRTHLDYYCCPKGGDSMSIYQIFGIEFMLGFGNSNPIDYKSQQVMI